jgi:hypothetical protein
MRANGVAMRLLCTVALACAGLTVVACGGASTPPPAPGSPQKPLVAERPQPGERSRESESAAPASSGNPGYETLVSRQSHRPRTRFSPCNLVTEREAQAIVGAPVQDPIEAAQGPTCIYRSKDGKSFVTLAVQSLDVDALKPRLRLRRRVDVAGRTAYCGTYGQPVLYVELSHRRVLSVTGQCTIATRFARTAVRQL